jgi:hypothetical protein
MVGTQDLYADCYMKKGGEFVRWDQAIENTLYSKICNDEFDKDLLKMEEYKLTSIEGEGIGTEI